MLGRLNHDEKSATIVGAGIAGLLAGYRLLRKGFAVEIFEKSNRPGGLIETLQTEHGIVEKAAHSVRSSTEILQLFEDLRIPYAAAKTRRKYIYREERLRTRSLSLPEIFTALTRAAFKKSASERLSLADWAKLHLGEAALDGLFAPLAHGIYAAEPEELDQELAFPRLSVPQGKSLLRHFFPPPKTGHKSFVLAPRDGMQALTDRLAAYIEAHPQGRIHYDSQIDTLPAKANLVVAVPAASAASLLPMPELAYAPMISATVFVRGADIKNPAAIGVLMARGEDRKILGILFNSATFGGRTSAPDIVSLTVMLGGTGNSCLLDLPDCDIETLVGDELQRVLSLKSPPLAVHITRWPRAIPLYSPALSEALGMMQKSWCADSGRIIAGNYTGEVSIRGMCQSSLAWADR